MAVAIICRSPAKEIITKMTPSIKIRPYATSTVIFIEPTELRIATELIPGARQNGRLVYSAIATLHMTTAQISAVKIAPLTSPACSSILGMVART